MSYTTSYVFFTTSYVQRTMSPKNNSMSGAGRRTVKGTVHPVAVAARPPAADTRQRDQERQHAPDLPAKAAPKSPQSKGKKKSTGAGDDARKDALSEARDMVESVAVNDEGNNKTPSPASLPPESRKADRAVTFELNKEKAECVKLQAETERLRKELDNLVKEKKRKKALLPNQRLLLSELSDRGGVQFRRAQLFLERGTWYVLRSRLFIP